MGHRLAFMGLVLAKHHVAIHWTQTRAPTSRRWMLGLHKGGRGVAEWSRLRVVATDESAEQDLELWGDMLDKLAETATSGRFPKSFLETRTGDPSGGGFRELCHRLKWKM
ncbi:hypothetical protein NDU88_004629 [Pleurodeles waltl]|uniref:Uncharacterized protein n=1 Tax=Pleurodeles waltl TaxID=8319 RepID=A0AAV7MC87_PLEWA|nr:hypothetical protein NDU88_004629 [Pleurodeles waltl]